jgi:hypothetical protein
MKHIPHHVLLAAALATGVTFALPSTHAAAFAGDDVSTSTAPDFVPDTGQINRGFDDVVPSSAAGPPASTPAQARAAFMMPGTDQPALGKLTEPMPNARTTPPEQEAARRESENASGGPEKVEANGNETMGSGSSIYTLVSSTAPSTGPIGATGQTMPAKFSQRNDVLDRAPIMAWPLSLSEEERQRIYQAVMADKAPAARDAEALAPASELDVNQALNEMHPLPASVSNIAGARALVYVKSKNKVFLVNPALRTVVDEIGS